jgi:hypothetical protein
MIKKIALLVVLIIILAVLFLVYKKPQSAPVTPDQSGLPQLYENKSEGFSIRVPGDYSVKEYTNSVSTNKNIHGIEFTLPKSISDETNLSSDSFISVESIPSNTTCTADMFLDRTANGVTSVTEGDITYSVASSSDAAAGNRYEQTVYALPWTHPCIAVRYFLHWGVFENYPTGTKKEFDKAAILSTFDKIRKTLIINQ